MDENFIAELRERLIAHYSAGAWRVPLAVRAQAVPGSAHRWRIVCGGAEDAVRALTGLRRAGAAPAPALAMAAALASRAGLIARLRTDEGFDGDHVQAPEVAAPELPAGAPWLLLSSAGASVAMLSALLVAGARDGMIWKPAPRAAASAHLVMATLGPFAGGRLALVQGDHATGAALVQPRAPASGAPGPSPAMRLIWAGAGAPPRDLPPPEFTLPAAAPARP